MINNNNNKYDKQHMKQVKKVKKVKKVRKVEEDKSYLVVKVCRFFKISFAPNYQLLMMMTMMMTRRRRMMLSDDGIDTWQGDLYSSFPLLGQSVHIQNPFSSSSNLLEYYKLHLQVSIRKSEGRVKIYNVKMLKTEMASKLFKNPFGFLQTNPQILAERLVPFCFLAPSRAMLNQWNTKP